MRPIQRNYNPFIFSFLFLLCLAACAGDKKPTLSPVSDASKAISLTDMPADMTVAAEAEILSEGDERAEETEAIQADALSLPKQAVKLDKNFDDVVKYHPSVQQGQDNICQAHYMVLQTRSQYFPHLDLSLSGGDKIIDRTTRADEFGGSNSPEYDGKGINATLSLRQQLYDWGRTGAAVKAARFEEQAAILNFYANIGDQLEELITYVLDYIQQDQLHRNYQIAYKNINTTVERIEAQYQAGAGRIADLRAAQVVLLDSELAVSRAARTRDQLAASLATNFGITIEQARQLASEFRRLRPEIPPQVDAKQSIRWRVLDIRAREAEQQVRRLRAARWPAINGVVTLRGWDIDNFEESCGNAVPRTDPNGRFSGGTFRRLQDCRSHEVTGNIEVSIPLYDGGSNRAQQGQENARKNSLLSEIAAFERHYQADRFQYNKGLRDNLYYISENTKKLDDIRAQLNSELKLQGQTRSNAVAIGRLYFDLAQVEDENITLQIETEKLRLRALHLAGVLPEILGIALRAERCE